MSIELVAFSMIGLLSTIILVAIVSLIVAILLPPRD